MSETKKRGLGKAEGNPGRARQGKAQSALPDSAGFVPRWRRVLELVLFLAAALVSAAAALLWPEKIIARDALYHLRHASLYLINGLFMREFPWVAYSVINTFSADIWYGFHLLLIPFAPIPDPTLQVKAAGILVLTASLLLFFFALRRSEIAYPFFWPFLLFFPFVWRLAQTRPNVISMGLTALLFSFLLSGGIWGVFFVSLALTFFHLSFFWLGILVTFAVAAVKVGAEKTWEWRKALAALGGLTAGWLLRPNPIGAAKILYVQTLRLIFEKQKGTHLAFGRELYPAKPGAFFAEYGLFVVIWLALAGLFLSAIFLRRAALPGRSRALLWSGLVLSLLFFGMTLFFSGRIVDLWAPFAVIFIAAAFTHLFTSKGNLPEQPFSRRMRAAVTYVGAIVFAATVLVSVRGYGQKMERGVDPYRLRPAAEWLREHSRPGAIVFHASWGIFPELFYWNPQNRYIGGMDPIFQYAYDKRLYWKTHHLLSGRAVSRTWGTADSNDTAAEDLYVVLRRDFKASYILVEKYRSPALYLYLTGDPRFVRRFEDGWAAVFQLRDSGEVDDKP